MSGAVLYATGSTVIVDVEESLRRAGVTLVGGVRNHQGDCQLGDASRSVNLDQIGPEHLAVPFLVPLFTPANRRAAANEARQRGFRGALTLVDPTAVLPAAITLGEGTYVGAAVTIGARSRLGDFCFVNRSASLGHHFDGGDFVSIGPGAVAAGHVTMEAGSVAGAGAVILPGIRVGAGAVVAAGAVVSRDVPASCLVAGNPARVVRSDLPGWEDGAA